jgi:hypothetical protein
MLLKTFENKTQEVKMQQHLDGLTTVQPLPGLLSKNIVACCLKA